MGPLVVIVVCLLAGAVLRKTQRLPENSHVAIDAFVINVALPALVLADLHPITLNSQLLSTVAVVYVLFAVSVVLLSIAARVWHFNRATFGALVLTVALSNTSFVGVPMTEAFFGAQYKPIALLMDQLGTAILLSTVGVVVASVCAGEALRASAMVKRVVLFPPFIALCAALALHGVTFPGWLQGGLAGVGATLAPLALFSVGLQMRIRAERELWRPIAVGLASKLIVAPAIVAALYFSLFAHLDTTMRVALFEAATPPMIGGAILSTRYKLALPLPSLLVGIGVPLSFLTMPVWAYLLHHA